MKIEFASVPAQKRISNLIAEELNIKTDPDGNLIFENNSDRDKFLKYLESNFVKQKKLEDPKGFYRSNLPVIFRLSKMIRKNTGLPERKFQDLIQEGNQF